MRTSLGLRIATPVSAEFEAEVERAITKVPRSVLSMIQTAGWRITLAEFVVDGAPALRGQHPRGWPSGTTWEHSDAVHLPYQRLLVLAEKRLNRRGEVVPATRTFGVMRHELGHAFDMAYAGRSGFRSAWPDFTRCYQADIAELDNATRQQLKYYMQGGSAGRQEAFAEAFAIHLGGGSDAYADEFRAAFPQVMGIVRQLLDRFEEPALAEEGTPAETTAAIPQTSTGT